MKNMIMGLLVILLAPLANATTYTYVESNVNLAGGGSFDTLFTQYDDNTGQFTWALDNMLLNGELMDGFWLVTNSGASNPEGDDGLSILYADFNTNSLWAFGYGGENEPASFNTEPYLGDFSAGLFSIGNTLGFSINAGLLTAPPYDSGIGIWFRPTWNTVTETDNSGRLTSFDYNGFSWHDISGGSTSVVPIPGALLLYGSAIFGLGLIRKARSRA